MSQPYGSNKLIVKDYDDSATSASIVWSAVAGKRHVPARLVATSEDGGELQVFYESNVAGKRLVNMYAPAGGGVAWQYDPDTAPVAPAGTDIFVQVASGNVKVLIEGFEYQDVPQA